MGLMGVFARLWRAMRPQAKPQMATVWILDGPKAVREARPTGRLDSTLFFGPCSTRVMGKTAFETRGAAIVAAWRQALENGENDIPLTVTRLRRD